MVYRVGFGRGEGSAVAQVVCSIHATAGGLVPTMIAAIYGMNFEEMPELRYRYAYYVVLGVIALSCVVLHRIFKRSGWL